MQPCASVGYTQQILLHPPHLGCGIAIESHTRVINMCLWMFEGVVVAMELTPENWTSRVGRVHPGGSPQSGSHRKASSICCRRVVHLSSRSMQDSACQRCHRPYRASFSGSSKDPSIFNKLNTPMDPGPQFQNVAPHKRALENRW